MNKTQVNNFLWCLSHFDDANYLSLHSRISAGSLNESHDLDHDNDHDHEHNHDHDINDNDSAGNLLVVKIVAMVVLFSASTLCGSIPFLFNRCFKWTESNTNARSATVVKCLLHFGGGVLLCTTFLHLLPEVQETVEQLEECGMLPKLPFALAEMLMCAGFFLMYLVEEIIHAFIHRNKQLLQHDNASAAFERGHSVRNSYLVKDGKKPQETTSPPKSALNAIECPTIISLPIASSGLLPQDLITRDLDQQKYAQPQANLQSYSEQLENLDHHHLHHHHHHHHHAHAHHHHEYDYGHGHSHLQLHNTGDGEELVASSLRGLLIVLALSLHELFEGMSIGLEGSASSVWFMFGAVSAHKLVLAFCVGVELIVARTRILLALVYVVTFAIVSPIGIGIGILVSNNEDSTVTGIPSAILQGLACGTLLYVVFFEILSKNRAGLLAYLAIFVGFAAMFGLQSLGTDEHGHSHGSCGGTHSHHSHDITKSLLLGKDFNEKEHHLIDTYQKHEHQYENNHDAHVDHSHESTISRTSSDFEQQLRILRSASRELMENIKKHS